MAWVNDLISFYKEFDEPRDQICLVNVSVCCNGTTLDEALKKSTDDITVSSEQLVKVFKDKDPKFVDTIRSFMHGHVAWHTYDPRNRLNELCDRAGDSPAGATFREYQQAESKVGSVQL